MSMRELTAALIPLTLAAVVSIAAPAGPAWAERVAVPEPGPTLPLVSAVASLSRVEASGRSTL